MTHTPQAPQDGPPAARSAGFHNSGLYIGGQNTGAVAFGDHAQAIQRDVSTAGDDRARLDDLLQELADGLRGLGRPDADEAIEDIQFITAELDRTRQDRPRILQLMDRVMAVAAPVGSLLQVAETARQLITSIVH